MNPKIIYQIQQLLDRYYNGESTPPEEVELQALLEEHTELPESMQADASLFLQMNGICNLATQQAEEEAMSHLPEGFEARLQTTLDKLEKSEIGNNLSLSGKKEIRRGFGWMQRVAACASVVAIIGAAIGFMNISADPFTDTCATTEQAEYQLNRALTLVNTFSKAGLSEARIDTHEQPVETMPASRFISFD